MGRKSEKVMDENRAENLWRKGYSDEAIGRELGCSTAFVAKWRKTRKLMQNCGRLLDKEEIPLPEVGWIIKRVPYWLESDLDDVPPIPARVVAVNRKHLCYTVEYFGLRQPMRETFKGI